MKNANSSLNDRDRAAQRHLSLSRRAFLRGLGVCVAPYGMLAYIVPEKMPW